mmetsp:Transcript_98755/g.235380  ORF Transcript_98755/g.235380 Transcript_98755/m.235380 type:complete len:389 (-) Transcript_98755:420-1586(-)
MGPDQVPRQHLLQHPAVAFRKAAAEQDVVVGAKGRGGQEAEGTDVPAQERQRLDGKFNRLHLGSRNAGHQGPRQLVSRLHGLGKFLLQQQQEGLVHVEAHLHTPQDLAHVGKLCERHLALLVYPHEAALGVLPGDMQHAFQVSNGRVRDAQPPGQQSLSNLHKRGRLFACKGVLCLEAISCRTRVDAAKLGKQCGGWQLHMVKGHFGVVQSVKAGLLSHALAMHPRRSHVQNEDVGPQVLFLHHQICHYHAPLRRQTLGDPGLLSRRCRRVKVKPATLAICVEGCSGLHHQAAEYPCATLGQHEAAQLPASLGLMEPTALMLISEGEHCTAKEVVVNRHANAQTAGEALLMCQDAVARKEVQHAVAASDALEAQIAAFQKRSQKLGVL